jgi:serine/threonine-protein kinase
VEPSPDDPVTPVAPTIDDPEKPAKPVRHRERVKSEGIPMWLSVLGYLSTFLALAAVGFWIFYSANTNREVTMPDVRGKSFNEAAEELQGSKLKLRRKGERVSDEPEDTVLETNPAPSRTARENSFVDAIVSAGSKFVELPDLKGESVDDARTKLRTLKLEVETQPRRDNDFEPNQVVDMSPSPKAKVERGSKVILYVNTSESVSNSRRTLYSYKLDIEMPTGSVPIKVRVEMTDGSSTQTVHEKEHMPSDKFFVRADGYGSTATFRIYFDDVKVEEITKEADSGGEPINEDE